MLNKFTFKEFRNKKTRIMVTPEMAKELLSRNFKGNRNISQGTVNTYARDMRRGQWKHFVPIDEIVISENGHLINGQHRLNAVVESGETIGFSFRWDVPEDMFMYLDNGKKRKASDFVNGKYYIERANLAKSVLYAEHGTTFVIFGKAQNASGGSVYSPSRKEIADRANEDTLIYEACEKGRKLNNVFRNLRLIPKSIFNSFCWLIFKRDGSWEMLDNFISELGNEFTLNVSARACQKTFTDLGLNKDRAKPNKAYLMSILLKSYANYCANSSAKTIKKPESYRDEYEKMIAEILRRDNK